MRSILTTRIFVIRIYFNLHLLYTKIDKLINTQPINYTFFVKKSNFFSKRNLF